MDSFEYQYSMSDRERCRVTDYQRQQKQKKLIRGLIICINLVDPASSHMLISKTKPCMSKYKLLYNETANSSLKQL